jgi:hypothetical protein
MAHFAQLDENNTVTQVVVVSDVDTCNEEGFEVEEIGQQFLKNMYGQDTRWVKTSYNGTIRKNYAGVGYTYNEKLDAFIPPKPYESWIFDENLFYYVAPVPRPEKEGKVYFWDEETQKWNEQDFISPLNN